jgi:hypothetical protein
MAGTGKKSDKRTIGTGDLCINGMDDMQYLYYCYNIVAYFERKLPFLCKAARIMTIIKNNYRNLQCATIQSRARVPGRALFFKGKGKTA